MRLLKRQITSPKADAVLMFLLGWTLADLGAVFNAAQSWFATPMIVVGYACFVIAAASAFIAWRNSWREPSDDLPNDGPHT